MVAHMVTLSITFADTLPVMHTFTDTLTVTPTPMSSLLHIAYSYPIRNIYTPVTYRSNWEHELSALTKSHKFSLYTIRANLREHFEMNSII